MKMSYRSNSFSRAAANEARMGAYYTDPAHCRAIGEMFHFPEEFTLLEPCIGDAKAVLSITGGCTGAKIFGVELNDRVAEATKGKEGIEECIHADFVDGVIISQNAFSFCFCNPPYMDDDIGNEGRERLEKIFLTKIVKYLKKGGILVFVIPERILPVVSRLLMGNFEMAALYRFWPEEYARWKQIVYVGIKTDKRFCSKGDVELFMERIRSIEELPVHPQERIVVPAGEEKDIRSFCTKEFDVRRAYDLLDRDEEISYQMSDYKSLMKKLVTQKEYGSSEIGNPLIPLKKDLLYLMSTSGEGQGLAGTEGVDLHMQRGSAEVVEDEEFEEGEKEQSGKLRVTTRTQITMKIVQTDGTITTLS